MPQVARSKPACAWPHLQAATLKRKGGILQDRVGSRQLTFSDLKLQVGKTELHFGKSTPRVGNLKLDFARYKLDFARTEFRFANLKSIFTKPKLDVAKAELQVGLKKMAGASWWHGGGKQEVGLALSS